MQDVVNEINKLNRVLSHTVYLDHIRTVKSFHRRPSERQLKKLAFPARPIRKPGKCAPGYSRGICDVVYPRQHLRGVEYQGLPTVDLWKTYVIPDLSFDSGD